MVAYNPSVWCTKSCHLLDFLCHQHLHVHLLSLIVAVVRLRANAFQVVLRDGAWLLYILKVDGLCLIYLVSLTYGVRIEISSSCSMLYSFATWVFVSQESFTFLKESYRTSSHGFGCNLALISRCAMASFQASIKWIWSVLLTCWALWLSWGMHWTS